jgi:hypothetical protein
MMLGWMARARKIDEIEMWKVGGTDMGHSVPEPVRIWWYKRAHLCDLCTELCHIILFLMNQRKERVRVTQSADAEKRGNDEAERAKKRCVIRMGLQAIVGRKPNATVFGPEWIHCVLRSACVRLLQGLCAVYRESNCMNS